MKRSTLISILFVFITLSFSCKTEHKSSELSGFVSEVFSINPDELTGTEPIVQIDKFATQKADKIISIDKTNIAEAIREARKYKNTIIVIGSHTLIKIKDLDDCQKSTAWGTSMPKGIGLTQKNGAFEKHTDYINNLMGKPDRQSRVMYLFK